MVGWQRTNLYTLYLIITTVWFWLPLNNSADIKPYER